MNHKRATLEQGYSNDEMGEAESSSGVSSLIAAQGQAGGGNAMVAERLAASIGQDTVPGIEGDLALMSTRFGQDFSDVSVNIGGDPDSADALGARAWTHGRSVAFRPGEYTPGTPEGQARLAHELTHVLQQGSRPEQDGWVKTAAQDAEGHLDTVTELLRQSLHAIDQGRIDAASADGAAVEPEAARAPLERALAQLGAFRSPERSRDAADLSLMLLQAADHDEATEAAATAEALHDVDAGSGDALEQEAERSARSAMAGRSVAPVSPSAGAPRAQRMAQAIALPLILGPPGWLIAAVAALGIVVVGYAAFDSARPITSPKTDTTPKTESKDKTKPIGVPTTLEKTGSERRDWGMMRFQVQWNTRGGGPTFSQSVPATAEIGVTVAQAIAGMNAALAQVSPSAARSAAATGVAEANAWILKRPPMGIAQGGYSKSFRFHYKGFTDARADVENIKGHNLRA